MFTLALDSKTNAADVPFDSVYFGLRADDDDVLGANKHTSIKADRTVAGGCNWRQPSMIRHLGLADDIFS